MSNLGAPVPERHLEDANGALRLWYRRLISMAKSKEVEEWFSRYQNPMKEVVLRVREIVLGADARIDECIKWQAPTFIYEGNLASFSPTSKEHASLMFHIGARIPGDHPRLEGSADTGRLLKVDSLADADKARKDIERIVRAWCDWRAAEKNAGRKTSPGVAKISAVKMVAKQTGASRRSPRDAS
jgi:hypothetical protein